MKLILLILTGLALHAQQTQLFSITNGDTTCKFHTNAATPTTIDYTCTNPRGSSGGYYAPNPANPAYDVFGVQLGPTTGNTGSNNCMVAVNMTSLPVTMGSFIAVPPNSAAFQCAGGSGSTVPLAPPPALKKGK